MNNQIKIIGFSSIDETKPCKVSLYEKMESISFFEIDCPGFAKDDDWLDISGELKIGSPKPIDLFSLKVDFKFVIFSVLM